MERELWETLCRFATMLYNRQSHARYGDDVICAVFWWAAIHDRPARWACHADNWPASLAQRSLPSQPTMSRRLRSAAVERLLEDVEQALLMMMIMVDPLILAVDGKALPVGGPSKDADAAWGRIAGGSAKGYKLHVVWGLWRGAWLPIAWALTALNASERRIAAKLLAELPCSGYVLGDKHYDVNYLYDAAAKSDYQLLAAQQRPGRGLGHRRHSAHRIRGLALLGTSFGKELYRKRRQVEHQFARLTNFVGGLGPLPFWVRRFHRVKLWIHNKLLIHAAHQFILARKPAVS